MGPIALEEYELMKDSKYRVYVNAIDKALKNFEYSSEWADLIAALGKLNKVIVSNTKFPVIPRRIKISKRLAQCMHPALPFGVHLKALETYDLIFKSMGTNRLSHELFIYSAGLFPLLGNAAMKVRPALLTVYETHFVPLGHRLRPALSGFLSGVLPGLEENSDHFVRTNSLLEKVCEGVGPVHFYGCLWDCLASNSCVRLPAISFLLAHFNKKLPTEDQPHIMGSNIETMVCGLMACVQDSSVLVQRCALDLLLLGFPMHNSHLTTEDMIRLVTASLSTILRRDMSLNRRLYAWLLGSEVNMTILAHHPLLRKAKLENKSTSYFEVFSKEMLVKAIKIILDNAIGVSPHDLKPYKLLVSLLDKHEIGNIIVDDILFEIFRLLYLCYNVDSKSSNASELLKCANLLFGSLEPRYLWQYIGKLFSIACTKNSSASVDLENPVKRVSSGDPGIVEICTLTEFLLDIVSLETYTDAPNEHLPALFLQIITLLTNHCDTLTSLQVAKGLQLCAKILTRVQPIIIRPHSASHLESFEDPSDSSQITSIQQDSTSSDYNQNTDSSSIDEKIELPSDDSTPSEKTDSLLEQCLRQYERFYVTFTYGTRLKVGETKSISTLLEALKIKVSNAEETQQQLSNLLLTIITRIPSSDKSSSLNNDSKCSRGKEWVEPMNVASRLLVDLSTLQTFFQSPNSKNVLDSECCGKDTSGAEFLPEWLRVLIICACWLNSSVSLQLVAITTLLDLVVLCTTAQSLVTTTVDDGVTTPLLIVPLLTPAHLKYMEKHTFIFQVIAHWLWIQLGDGEHQVRCVELLHQLHSALSNSDIVESCIAQYLKGNAGNQMDKLDSFRRFSSLWHIGREVNAKMGNSLRISDIFYKSMLKMLDNLKLPENDCLKMEAQEWLLHSLMRGDVHRILDPILYMLLDPSTARLSVLHIRIKQDEDKPSDNPVCKEDLKNVCAISSVDGTIIYHIDQKKEITSSKKDKQITAVTAISGQVTDLNQKYITEKHSDEDLIDHSNSTDKESHHNISLYINPFTSESTEINTDFDEYFEDIDTSNALEKPQNEETLENKGVLRNRSFPALQKELNKKTFALNEALKISSVDLLNLSDTLFTKVSDGESLSTRLNRGSFSSDGLSTIPCLDNSELVRSWSFPGKDMDSSDLEESTVAEEYFNSGQEETISIVEDILSDLLDRVAILSGDTEPIKPATKPKSQIRRLHYQSTITSHGSNTDHLHSHLLLYRNKYDADKILYAMETLRNILVNNPRAFICACSSTGLVTRSTILKMVARHRKSLFGRGFSGDLEGTNIRSAMYLEVIIITCLYFIRSYYPHVENVNVTRQDIIGNKEVQMSCTEVLTLLCSHLIDIVRESSKSLACYLADLFSRLKLYKVLLHCVLTSVYYPKYNNGHFSHQILKFNEGFGGSKDRLPRHSETLQKQLIRLLLFLIILEYEINNQKGEKGNTVESPPPETNEIKYINGKAIPQQPLFHTIISRALENQPYSRHTHAHWTSLVACSLPFQGPALTKVVTTALKQICHNIEELSHCYSVKGSAGFPADYGITQIEALTVLCHFCLLDTSAIFNQPQLTPGGPSSSQIFNHLSHLFVSSPLQSEPNKERNDAQVAARKSVLGHLPRVIASVAVLWQALVKRKEREGDNCEVGSPRVVKQQILDFLSPIAVHHATSFLAAMAVVWRERRPTIAPQTLIVVMPQASEDQQVLVQLLNGIKAMPIDTLVQTLHQVVKQPAMNQEIAVSVEVSALELFVNYTQSVAGSSLHDSWNSLLQLLKEAPTLSPPAQFLLLGALSQFVQRCPPFTDKKDQKDLQDITTKLVESCTTIAGACLEQTTWLRRNLAVREEEPAAITPDREDKYFDDLEPTEIDSLIVDETITEGKPKKTHKSKLKRVTKKIRQDAEKLQIRAMHQWFMRAFVNEANLPLDLTEKSKSGGSSMAQYSVTSLTVLAHLLAPLLDVAFGSQEKERVVNLLTNLMYNVTPYLKNHTQRNAGSYFACSQLLSSLSSYQYTRKAWKKDVMELLFDPSFFQMELRSLKYWCTVVDNLVSQENSTFREFMNRVSMPQGNSLNIFSSKEQEYEQRAQLLKRLAFVIYCGENDQYHNNMPEIQERLAESVKLPQLVPNLQAQVFLCFRVLLLRMSPVHIIPLWPTIISEMVQVMIHMELDLSTDYEDFRRNCSSHIRALSSMDWSNNGIQPVGSWLQLQLSAANLLFLAVQMPADRLPQFQMYRWAFVGEEGIHARNTNNIPDFIPHVTRIANLMDAKYGGLEAVPTPLLPTSDQIRSLQDLHPFFTAMSTSKYTPLSVSQLEHNLELDLLDAMAPR